MQLQLVPLRAGRELDAREDGYWNDFNDFKLSLRR
jgi:hypothetical protein